MTLNMEKGQGSSQFGSDGPDSAEEIVMRVEPPGLKEGATSFGSSLLPITEDRELIAIRGEELFKCPNNENNTVQTTQFTAIRILKICMTGDTAQSREEVVLIGE